jgi:hypothetical protein
VVRFAAALAAMAPGVSGVTSACVMRTARRLGGVDREALADQRVERPLGETRRQRSAGEVPHEHPVVQAGQERSIHTHPIMKVSTGWPCPLRIKQVLH